MHHSGFIRGPGFYQVILQGVYCLWVELQEQALTRAAAQGFDPNAACAAKQVKKRRVYDIRGKDIKKRFFHPVGDRAGGITGDGFQSDAPGGTRNDPRLTQWWSFSTA